MDLMTADTNVWSLGEAGLASHTPATSESGSEADLGMRAGIPRQPVRGPDSMGILYLLI
jgi:hypothetical protein